MNDDNDCLRVLLHVLRYAIAELRMVDCQPRWFMQRDQGVLEEEQVLSFERNGEAVDDGTQDLEQLCDSIVSTRLINETVEHL